MSDRAFDLPEGVEVVAGPRGPRLRGPAAGIAVAVEELRNLRDQSTGYRVRLAEWTLMVDDEVPAQREPLVVTMPGKAWNIAASVLRDVAYGEYDSPFDFGDVGYLSPPPDPDIGVEVVGPTLPGAR